MTVNAMLRLLRLTLSHHGRWLLLCVLLLCALSPTAAQTGDGGELIFLAPPLATSQEVTLEFLVRAAGLPRYDLLTTANFRIGEAAENIRLAAEPTAPMMLTVMVNLGYASDADLIRSTLRAYFDTYYRPGDEVVFYIFGSNLVESFEPADLDGIRTLIDGFTASTLYSPLTSVLSGALDRVRTELTEDPTRAFQALLVGSYLVAADDPSIAGGFAALNVPLNVVQAHRFRDDSTAKLRAFAANGGGLFVNNLNGRFIETGAEVRALSTLDLAFEALNSSRSAYTLSYRPLRRDLDTQPEVTLGVQLAADQQIDAAFTYQREFTPPQVELAAGSLDLRRTPRRAGDDVAFDVDTYELSARVVFPDDINRQIDSVRVELLGADDDRVLHSALDQDPDIDGLGNFEITLPLDRFDLPDSETAFRLVVTVTDELGLSGTAARDGSVTVAALPPLPTPTPQPTTPPTATVTPLPSPTHTLVPQATVVAAATPTSLSIESTPVVYLFSGIILFLVAIIVLMLISLRRTRRRQPVYPGTSGEYDTDAGQPDAVAVNRPNAAPPDMPAPVENKLVGRMINIKGLPAGEVPIMRDEFVIGRGDTCDYVIAEPYISPRHCMIIHRGGKFTIRDLKSKNGVFVNGERIPVERDVIVPIGSEVGITQNIIVELWDPTTIVHRNSTRSMTSTQMNQSQVSGTEALFRPLLGIRYVDDEEEVSDDYSPL
ncbi:MAG: FHA domain-containing protein [Anaerolinea sp.]|nr:FHA domain-containing protein [Anaerolinea sp.]